MMKKFFLEEKKGSMLPRVAPELSMDTWWYYKAAHLIDQSWSVRAAGLRQRHIDQAQSMNLYITNDYSMRQAVSYTHLDVYKRQCLFRPTSPLRKFQELLDTPTPVD